MPTVWVCGSASLLHASEGQRDDHANPGVPALWEKSSHEREGDRTMNNYDLAKLLRDAADALEKSQKVLDATNIGKPLKSLLDFDKLPARAKHIFHNERIDSVDQLTSLSEDDLLEKRNCGEAVVRTIRDFLAANGLYLRLEGP